MTFYILFWRYSVNNVDENKNNTFLHLHKFCCFTLPSADDVEKLIYLWSYTIYKRSTYRHQYCRTHNCLFICSLNGFRIHESNGWDWSYHWSLHRNMLTILIRAFDLYIKPFPIVLINTTFDGFATLYSFVSHEFDATASRVLL